MKSRGGKIVRYALFLSIGLGLLWWTYKDTDLSEISTSLDSAKWGWIAISLVLNYSATVIRGIRWNTLLQPLGYKADPWTCVHSVAFGYLMNDIVPRSGELARCGLLNRAEKIPVDKLFGTVILERIVDMMMLGVILLIALLIHRDALNHLFAQADGGKGNAVLFVLIAGIVFVVAIYFFLRIVKEKLWAQRIITFLRGVLNGLKSVFLLQQKGKFILYTLGIWGTWLLMTQTMMYALEDTQLMQMDDCLFLMVAASIGMIIPAPGGIGAYHFATMKGFEALGYATQTGLTFAAISWTGKTILEIVMGVTGFIAVTVFKMKKTNAG